MAPAWRGAVLLPLLVMAIVASIHAVPVRRPRYVITDGGRENIRPAEEVSAISSASGLMECKFENDTYAEGNEIETPNKCESCYCGPEGAMVCVPRCRQMVEPMSSGECHKDNKTYSNGQKIVMDPSGSGSGSDPCKVCYCVKGEVVCSPLACYRRDDCEPRFVPGRCCPEYDHCPFKDATDIEKSPNSGGISEAATDKKFEVKESHTKEQSSAGGNEESKKVITIKEVTPVSEIPSMGGVKIKEILPPAIEIHEFNYVSTKGPLTQREVPFTQDPEKTTQASIQPESITHSENITTTTAPPVIKIGDATVITVIGAEGLERGGGEEEDATDTKFNSDNPAKPNTTHLHRTENSDKIGETSNIVLQHSDLSDEIAEVMRELYATTTITSHTLSDSSPSSVETHAPYIADSDSIGKDSQHIQHEVHMNEEDEIVNRDHNIEFPPIPDDITIHHQDEAMEVSDTPASDFEKVETTSDEVKVSVNRKRPVFSLSSYQEPKEENVLFDLNPGKTLLNIHAIKHNDTGISNVMSADWLKYAGVPEAVDKNTSPDTIDSSVKVSSLLNLESELPQDILDENSSIKDTDFDDGEFTTMKMAFSKEENMLVDNPTNISVTTPSSSGDSTEFPFSAGIPNAAVDKDVIKNDLLLDSEHESTTSITITNNDSGSNSEDPNVSNESFTTTTTIYQIPIEISSLQTTNAFTTNTSEVESFIIDSKEIITPSRNENMAKEETADVLIELKQPELVSSKEMFLTTEKSQALQRNTDNDGNLDELISVTFKSITKSDHSTEESISDELTETNEFLKVKPTKDRTNVISDLINLVGDVVSIGDTPEGAKDSPGKNANLITGGHLYSGELLPVSNTVEQESKKNYESATSSPSDNVLSNNDISVETQHEYSEIKNKKMELEEELDINSQDDTTEGNENIEHTTKSVIIDHLTDSEINNMSSMEHKDIELLSNITLNKNTGPTKVIEQDDEEPKTTLEPHTTSGIASDENTPTPTSITSNDEESSTVNNNDYKQQSNENYNIITSTESSSTDSVATE